MKQLWRNVYFRYGLAILVPAGAVAALNARKFSIAVLSDGFAVSALLMAAMGAWRFVLRQGTFASTKYGYLKLKEIITTRDYRRGSLPGMGEYVRDYRYDKPVLPPFIAAAAAAAISLVIWAIA